MRYIGCKRLLLGEIERVIRENIKDNSKVFCDIFSGTACVAQHFKKQYKIISNDLLYFSFILQKATIEGNKAPKFKVLDGETASEYFNSLPLSEIEKLEKEKRFCQNNYSPIGNRMYMSEENALRIDFIRNKAEEWKDNQQISDEEYFYLLAVLIEAVPFISNISGTYGAYNKFWDKRSLNTLNLKEISITDNKEKNKCYNEDGNRLIEKISGDILYIDPPYNNRQYSPNYHVLETIARYNNPTLKGITGQNNYKENKSLYCNKKSALISLEDLIKKAKFKHIILSYSTEGLMKEEEIENIFSKYTTKVKCYKIPYRRFKSRETNPEKELCELIYYGEKI